MRYAKTQTILYCSIALLLLTISPAVFAQDAQSLLRRTSQVYASLKSYHFEGTSLLTVNVEGVSYRMNLGVEIAEGGTPDMQMTLRNKIPVWEKPIASAPRYYPQMPKGTVYNFAVLEQKVKTAKLLRIDSLKINGKESECYVIEVVRETNALETVWIDKSTRLVLRKAFQTVASVEGSQIQHNWVTTFTSFKINAAPPDWLIALKKIREDAASALSAQKIGTQAPQFRLAGVNGQEVNLADIRDKVILLVFWATWCLPCREEFPMLAKIERNWSAKGLQVLRVTDEPLEVVQAFLRSSRYKFPTLVEGVKVWAQYSVSIVPTTVVIDKTGKIVSYDVATLNEEELLQRLKRAGLDIP